MILYFTGIGNSLYAAKQLDNELISIPQAVRQGRFDFSADTIGIVTPIYGHEVPPMVREFMHKASFHTRYFYDTDLRKPPRRSCRACKATVR